MKTDNERNAEIDQFVERHRTEIVRNICKLIEIRSVAEDNSTVQPYGTGCRKVLNKALEISNSLGFETDNCDYYCGSASLYHSKDLQSIAFWGHLDVVPEGKGWNYPPFAPTLHQGYIVGRGAIDNKGPSVCALYALLFFKENRYKLNYNYKVIFGTNEERDMSDVVYYLQHRPVPLFSIIADSVFPVCFAEKGIIHAEVEFPIIDDSIIYMTGGSARNSVAGTAEAKLKKVPGTIIPNTEKGIIVEENRDYILVKATGVAMHASSPEGSVSAISVLSSYLGNIIQCKEMQRILKIILNITDSYDGSVFGIDYSDQVTGDLTCVAGVLEYADGKITLTLDIRYPITTDVHKMISRLKKSCTNFGARIVSLTDSKPCYVDPNDNLVTVLNGFYNEFMKTNVPPYYEGGGSYARKVPNSLAFGPILHNRKPKPNSLAKGGAHKTDESVCVDELLLALKIYILTILKLDNMTFK